MRRMPKPKPHGRLVHATSPTPSMPCVLSHHREAGIVGYGLTSRAYKELIYDRKHVCRVPARTIAEDALLGVSDATMAAGMPPNERFTMWGLEVVTGEDEVRLAATDPSQVQP